MCEPLSITAMALTAASVVANQIGASKVAKARDDTLAAERIRQTGLDAEAAALNTQSQDRYQDFGGQQEKRARSLGDYFTQDAVQPDSPVGQSIPKVSGLAAGEEGKQRGKATSFANQQGEALGSLRAFGDLVGGIGRDQARDAGLIGQIGGFKKGSAGVNALELDAANRKGDKAKLFGDLLGLAGTVATGAALAGGGGGLKTLSGDYNTIAGANMANPGYSITRF